VDLVTCKQIQVELSDTRDDLQHSLLASEVYIMLVCVRVCVLVCVSMCLCVMSYNTAYNGVAMIRWLRLVGSLK